ncbi:hypothetical protein KO488_02380 [Poseidonibacter lekithochrous]|uniref:hypothetical protein n=1 Tax=Poseidonibacter TaxID=2321187 RepID=UPI001C09483B|nr:MULTISPECIES: hypothetical protein [Poseidonibacter]MBU3013588.1 hypothetical protein [Poseidonibacter lekithochrous]MDO6826885.1 hypothetical protein [Poseidonibacter sp. 1_MG-2023]
MKLLTFIITISISLLVLYISLETSSTIGDIFITPITYIATLLEQNFSHLPYFIHALLIFTMGVFYILLFILSSRFFMRKLLSN